MNKSLTVAINEKIALEHISSGVDRKVLSYSEQMMVVEVHFEQGAVGEVHTHPHEQIAYVVSGRFEFEIDGQCLIVSAGDSIHFKPNQSHGTVCLEPGILLDTFTPYRIDFI